MNKQLSTKILQSAKRWVDSRWWKTINGIEKQLENAYISGSSNMYSELAPFMEWTSVEKRLPQNKEVVLVKTDTNCIATGYLCPDKTDFVIIAHTDNPASINLGYVTHWRKIEL